MATAGPHSPRGVPGLDPPVHVPLTVFPEQPCAYLPDRTARLRGFLAGRIAPEVYKAFMDTGFRRSGKLVYQPSCPGCSDCIPLRISVADFKPSKSQRRCSRRNRDLRVSVSAPQPTLEKYELYLLYLTRWHGRQAEEVSWDEFVEFLYESPVPSVEFCYRDADQRLLAVGLCDRCGSALSSVYFYWHPDQACRGLGTFGVLQELDYARQVGLTHYYLGYWINTCNAMRYKIGFKPNELLDAQGRWRSVSCP